MSKPFKERNSQGNRLARADKTVLLPPITGVVAAKEVVSLVDQWAAAGGKAFTLGVRLTAKERHFRRLYLAPTLGEANPFAPYQWRTASQNEWPRITIPVPSGDFVNAVETLYWLYHTDARLDLYYEPLPT